MKLSNVLHTLLVGSVLFFYNGAVAQSFVEPADIIIFNTKVITVNSNFAVAQAVAVRDGRIVAVGKDEEIKAYKGLKTRAIDGWGQVVMPGIYDSQVESWKAATDAASSDCPTPALSSIADAQTYIRKQAATNRPGTWIVLDNLFPTRLRENRLPTKAELDAATTNNPVYWNCGLLAVVNSKALVVSKIDDDVTNPPAGEVLRDPKTRKPSGVLRNASSLLKLPRPTHCPDTQQVRQALKHVYELYNRQGITSIGEQNTSPQTIDVLRELSKDHELTVRVNCARSIDIGTNADECADRVDALASAPKGQVPYGPTGVGDDWVRIGPLRTVLDGDIVTGTAYLRTPWGIGPTYQIDHPAYRGHTFLDPFNRGQLSALYTEAAQRGWQLAADATGDAAVDSLLNCYDRVQFNVDIRQRRFLITHANFQSAESWERCKDLGIAAEVSPSLLYKDGSSLINTLGEKRLGIYLPLKTWFDQGLVAGGSSTHVSGLDPLTAVNPWSPWLGIWTAVTRQTEQGVVTHPEQRLTRQQAIRLYTMNNARLYFEEKQKGSLEPGKLADLIMIDNDLLTCPVDDIYKTKVMLTMVDGKVVWQAKN
jgi:hypothetical protein